MSFRQRMAQVPWRAFAAESFRGFFSVTKWLCAIQVTTSYVMSLTVVMGPSMLPTLNLTGDVLVVNKVAKRWGQLNTGDVVLMRSPENPRKEIVKRIVGVEGDTVTYLVDPDNINTSKTVVVPKGHVWIQGDNIYSSNDSRKFGAVPRGLVEGKLFLRVWPPQSIGLIDSKVQYEPPAN